uniref:HTH_48 domain-containing protein n=1 Tax=Strongyloides papillosus TaxID=174720 RepID=A0A0N5BPZ3_STREA
MERSRGKRPGSKTRRTLFRESRISSFSGHEDESRERELPVFNAPDISILRDISRDRDERLRRLESRERRKREDEERRRREDEERRREDEERKRREEEAEKRRREEEAERRRREEEVERRRREEECSSRKYARLDDSSRYEARETSKIVSEGLSRYFSEAVESERERRERREQSRERSELKRNNYMNRTKDPKDYWACRLEQSNEAARKKIESHRAMLWKERKSNENDRQKYSKEIEDLNKELSRQMSLVTKIQKENDLLKKENSMLKTNLNNANYAVEKSHKLTTELQSEIIEKNIQLGLVNKELEDQRNVGINLHKDGKTFTLNTKKYVFGMLECFTPYEKIEFGLKQAAKCFFNQELECGISIRTIYKWSKEFKVCSLYVSGYLLKEFIAKKGNGTLFQDETTFKNEKLQTFIYVEMRKASTTR